jgi:hypothetical protein
MKGKRANGWLYWYSQDDQGAFRSIDNLREQYRSENAQPETPAAKNNLS